MSTYSAKPKEIEKKWVLIDAKNLVVGRLAAIIAARLKGKHKSTYTPHMDCGDNIIVINAHKVKFTGKKGNRNTGKIYYRHTGYMGGIKETTAGKILEGKFPERVLYNAVKGMLGSNGPLKRVRLSNLYLYSSSEHPHHGQTPETLDIGIINKKNILG